MAGGKSNIFAPDFLLLKQAQKELAFSIGCRGQKQVDCITLNSAVETSQLALKY
jgi:hypothetical protein